MFIPTTLEEIKKLRWAACDIILITGDVYIDSPYDGTAVIAKTLTKRGYKVGIISQPDLSSDIDIKRLGEPLLFWGVSSGAVDSMVANYTSLNKKRNNDDMTPGGNNDRRPDRAVIRYVNHIKSNFKNTKPIVIGGIEASLRRIAHYDFWSNSVRKSILFDSKADYLFYGMSEKSICEFADAIALGENPQNIRGMCYVGKEIPIGYKELSSYEEAAKDKQLFISMFKDFYQNNDPLNAFGLAQKHGDRYLIQNPPSMYLSQDELDKIYELDYEYDAHPFYKKQGTVKALETIKFSITTHRGCFGECNFCAIAVHQGRRIVSRSEDSVINEAIRLTKLKNFKGIIYDVGGASANMFDMNCKIQTRTGSCKNKRCIGETICKNMDISHTSQINMLNKIRTLPGVKKVFVSSGIRYDLILQCNEKEKYISNLAKFHVSGQLKIAPEHTQYKVLNLMSKPSSKYLLEFKRKFDEASKKAGKSQFLTYYFIAAHPGCSKNETIKMKEFINKELHINPEQIQVFTPTPSTYSTLMYYTELNPFTNEPLFIEKSVTEKRRLKEIITGTISKSSKLNPKWKK